jgi:hypothetical protein
MIDRLLAFPRLELKSFWKRPLPVFMYAILALLSLGLVAGGVQVAAGSADTGGAKLAINGGFNLAFVDVVIFAIVLPFFAAVACGMPLLVDGDRRIQKLLTATPLSWQEYAWSRFLAALAVLGVVLAAWLVCQITIYETVVAAVSLVLVSDWRPTPVHGSAHIIAGPMARRLPVPGPRILRPPQRARAHGPRFCNQDRRLRPPSAAPANAG